MKKSELEETLFLQICWAGLPEPRRQYRFYPKRQWRADFAWLPERVLVEVEGGIWLQTRTGRPKGHAHPERFAKDVEKYNHAALAGWTLIRVTEAMVRSGEALDYVERALEGRTE